MEASATPPIIRCLSVHARYVCHRSGACCSSNWPIPIEADRLIRVRSAMAAGALRPVPANVDVADALVASGVAPGDMPALVATRGGCCVFFERGAGHADSTRPHACRIHAALGHDALPLACRQFPRVVVRDPRGVSVTLSAYCPTVASALRADVPLTIVEGPPAFASTGEYEGLDARESLPPALRPDVLMDWNAWWEWERLAIETIAVSHSIDEALSRLRAAVDIAVLWRPGTTELIDHVRTSFARAHTVPASAPLSSADTAHRRREVEDAIPADLRPVDDRASTPVSTSDAVARRFLASHAFANWTIHLGDGLRAWLRSIDTAAALLASGLDVRQADLYLRHLADSTILARTWRAAERSGR